MDNYGYTLRKRLKREACSNRKRKAIKYVQFPQRPETRGTNKNNDVDLDQTDLFMFRTNTRLSFIPIANETCNPPPPSRDTGRPESVGKNDLSCFPHLVKTIPS